MYFIGRNVWQQAVAKLMVHVFEAITKAGLIVQVAPAQLVQCCVALLRKYKLYIDKVVL